MPFIVANYVYASSQGQRTHSARTNVIKTYGSLKQRISHNTKFKLVHANVAPPPPNVREG